MKLLQRYTPVKVVVTLKEGTTGVFEIAQELHHTAMEVDTVLTGVRAIMGTANELALSVLREHWAVEDVEVDDG
jgi:hypothetical protein